MSRLPIAAPSRRLAAFALDYIWIALYLLVLAGVGSYLAFGPLAPQAAALFASPVVSDLIILALTVLPVTLYFARQEAARGGTWGKRRLGLRVVRADGAHPSFGRTLLRAGVKFTPWQIAHLGVARLIRLAEPPAWALAAGILSLVLVAGYVALLYLSPSHRTVHDLAAGTMVVQEARPGREGNVPS